MLRKVVLSFQFLLISVSCLAVSPHHFPKIVTCKNDLKIYVNSGKYTKDIKHSVGPALAYLKMRIKKNSGLTHPKKLAVVFDIDETLLSNYNMMLAYDFGGNQKLYSAWEKAAEEPEIKETALLFHFAAHHGVTIFLVTGRGKDMMSATLKNLSFRNLTQFKSLTMWPLDSKLNVGDFKAQARCGIKKQGYDIVLNLGDQDSDMHGQCKGDRLVKLPNPFYYIPSDKKRHHSAKECTSSFCKIKSLFLKFV